MEICGSSYSLIQIIVDANVCRKLYLCNSFHFINGVSYVHLQLHEYVSLAYFDFFVFMNDRLV
jgi:hypothetical protein